MSVAILLGMACTVFLTSLLSGVFGMAGGLILLWVLLLLMPLGTAIAVHGVIQMVANGSRAWFSRTYIDYRILGILCLGLAISAVVLLFLDYKPNIIVVSIAIGLMPILVWLPVQRLHLDASKPSHALICGLIAGALTVGVGVSGPTIDIFFIRAMMDRRKVIATKAATQLISHATKVVFYWNAASLLPAADWVAIALAAPIAILGTRAGNVILQRLTDANFRVWTRWIVTGISAVYIVQGLQQLMF
ncbi:putative membrane protein YfcA [Pseudorhizobium tarimense]|uniref:Probable membrane transporter protein n=1 Tax=Pseudorhizobium tarimense TaxID=1079109 RepID=A0ABV2H9I8_9HYPH|nr:TSUP family transporter [Pseudorhizobium tarimense]MCJ8520162.1 TSUP family transporter [Pseudorhizobium tarimense]